MKRTQIIQKFINQINAKKYLEIGIGCGVNHSSIYCDYKVSVEPIPTSRLVSITHPMTSDQFFSQNKENFDIIFIDGLHWSEQVYKDIINSLNILNNGGFIICHDINPPDEAHQIYPQLETQTNWNGDCWKAWVKLKSERSDLNMYVIDTDYGCGIISRGNQELIEIENNLNYNILNNNRAKLLNLITVEEFNTKY